MGWSLGANNSANNFGTAVFSQKIRYRTAVILCAVFVIIGALLEGQAGMHTLGGLVEQTADSAFAATLAAALTATLMSVLKLPISTSQAFSASPSAAPRNAPVSTTGFSPVRAGPITSVESERSS